MSSHVIYENEILENKMNDLMETRLGVRSLMTVDDTLRESAGLRKTVNRYTYNGVVETLGRGEANSTKGTVTFTPNHYNVKRYQQTFSYNDLDVMQDPYLLDVAMNGAAAVMANQIADEYFAELNKIGNRHALSGDHFTYSDIVDALSTLGREVESDLFILMGADARADIRKDTDFIAAKQGEIVYSGQFGTVCGIPVLFSKKVPTGKMILTNKSAVRFFVKRESSLEQDRNIETKDNTVVYERHGLIALVDDTSSVIIGAGADTLNLLATMSEDGNTISVSEALTPGNSYRVGIGMDMALLGDDLSHLPVWNGTDPIVAKPGQTIIVAECNADGACVKCGMAIAA
ncbi:MAG: hypothetical protein J6D21_12055 [Clostridia bacterium]|nr:hypothetical protein [Clostridia bacterium]